MYKNKISRQTYKLVFLDKIFESKLPCNGASQAYVHSSLSLLMGSIEKNICGFRRVTHAINIVYRLISFLNQLLVLVFFVLFLYSSPRVQAKPVNRLSRTIAQKTRSDVRKCPLGKCFSKIYHFGGHIPQKPTKFRRQQGNPSQTEKVE